MFHIVVTIAWSNAWEENPLGKDWEGSQMTTVSWLVHLVGCQLALLNSSSKWGRTRRGWSCLSHIVRSFYGGVSCLKWMYYLFLFIFSNVLDGGHRVIHQRFLPCSLGQGGRVRRCFLWKWWNCSDKGRDSEQLCGTQYLKPWYLERFAGGNQNADFTCTYSYMALDQGCWWSWCQWWIWVPPGSAVCLMKFLLW